MKTRIFSLVLITAAAFICIQKATAIIHLDVWKNYIIYHIQLHKETDQQLVEGLSRPLCHMKYIIGIQHYAIAHITFTAFGTAFAAVSINPDHIIFRIQSSI